MDIDVRAIDEADRPWIRDLLASTWGLPVVTPTGSYEEPERLAGCVVGERAGVVLWDDDEGGRQVVALEAVHRRAGIGQALMAAARDAAWHAGVDRLWLITTDDNPTGLAFYPAIGMAEVRRLPGFIEVTRAAKPDLPVDAFSDAIEFEWDLRRLRLAVEENVAWCDHVARGAGVVTEHDADRWWATTRTPPLYPDAITRRPGLDAASVLAGIDRTEGCSVKDSFADLDLEPEGFEVLFEAHWLHVDEPEPGWRNAAYEHGAELEAALASGAAPLGRLRVWLSPPVGG